MPAASRSCAATTLAGTGVERARLRRRTSAAGASKTTAWAGTPWRSASARHAARRFGSSPVESTTVVRRRRRRFSTIRSSSSNASRLARRSCSPVPTTARRASDETTWPAPNQRCAQWLLPVAVAPTRTTRHGSGRRNGAVIGRPRRDGRGTRRRARPRAPAARTRSASRRSDVATRSDAGSASARTRRSISSSAASRPPRGACATSTASDVIGGEGACSRTTQTGASSARANASSSVTRRTIAPWRSRHQPSGREPITFIASTSQRVRPACMRPRMIAGEDLSHDRARCRAAGPGRPRWWSPRHTCPAASSACSAASRSIAGGVIVIAALGGGAVVAVPVGRGARRWPRAAGRCVVARSAGEHPARAGQGRRGGALRAGRRRAPTGASPPGRCSSTVRCGEHGRAGARPATSALHEGDPVVVERVSGLTLSVRRAEDWELIA